MSIESTVYSPNPAISLSELIASARTEGVEVRAYDEALSTFVPAAEADESLYDAGYVLLGWPGSSAETTATVDDAIFRGEKPVVDELGAAGKLAWCEITCHHFEPEKFKEDPLDAWDEEEEDDPAVAAELERIMQSQTIYFFRCGTSPPQNGSFLAKIASLIATSTGGFEATP